MSIVIQHNCSVIGPDGHYGVFQYQTGPGVLDAGTAFMLGPTHFQIPLPIFAIATLACVAIVLFLLCIRPGVRRHEIIAA